jgi:hypothetical protein
MHFQFTPAPLRDVPPQELWPTGADCMTIDANQTADLGRDAVKASPAPSSPPVVAPPVAAPPSGGASPVKKKVAAQLPGLWFWCWGQLLSLRISGRVGGAELGRSPDSYVAVTK